MEELKFDHSWVVCPLCGERYLHHTMIEAFERSEDAEKGMHIIVSHDHVDVKYDSLAGNPSSRRHGFIVKFCCELCGGEPVMEVSQHKGETRIGWCI
jgi:hypothetical protein